MTFKEAMRDARAGYRVRESRMSKGWKVGWFAAAKGFFCINPHTGSEYQYRPTDADKASTTWERVA